MTQRQGRGLCPRWAGCRLSCPCSICPDLSGSWAAELWEGGQLCTRCRSLCAAGGLSLQQEPRPRLTQPRGPQPGCFQNPCEPLLPGTHHRCNVTVGGGGLGGGTF